MKAFACFVLFAFIFESKKCRTSAFNGINLIPKSRSTAPCSPESCFYNYILETLRQFPPHAEENGLDSFEIHEKVLVSVPTLVSNLTFSYTDLSVSRLARALDRFSAHQSTSLFYGSVSISIPIDGATIEGFYSAEGTVGREDVSYSGSFQTTMSSILPFLTSETHFVVNDMGLVNVASQTTEMFPAYSISPFDGFENMLNNTHPFLSLIVESHGQQLVLGLTEALQPFKTLFENYIKSSLQDAPIFDLAQWENSELHFPRMANDSPSNVTEETEKALDSCLSGECVLEFMKQQGALLRRNGLNGSRDVHLNLTACNRTETYLFDFETCYSDVIIEQFYSDFRNLDYQFKFDITKGIIVFWFEIDLRQAKGIFDVKGTLMGEEFSYNGAWAASFQQQNWGCTLTFDISEDDHMTFGPSSCDMLPVRNTYYTWTTWLPQNYEADYMFKRELWDQFNETLPQIMRDNVIPEIITFFQDGLQEVPFSSIFSAVNPSKSHGKHLKIPIAPLKKFATTIGELCDNWRDPDSCFMDYVRSSFALFPDWLASEWQDPIRFPQNFSVSLQENTWGFNLSLTNVTNFVFIPNFFASTVEVTSSSHDETFTITPYVSNVQFRGSYFANGSLAGHSTVKENGDWTLNGSAYAKIKLRYIVGSEGYIDTISVLEVAKMYCYSYSFIGDFLETTHPLRDSLNGAAANGAAAVVCPELSQHLGIVVKFLEEVLAQETFYHIITGGRYVTTETTHVTYETTTSTDTTTMRTSELADTTSQTYTTSSTEKNVITTISESTSIREEDTTTGTEQTTTKNASPSRKIVDKYVMIVFFTTLGLFWIRT